MRCLNKDLTFFDPLFEMRGNSQCGGLQATKLEEYDEIDQKNFSTIDAEASCQGGGLEGGPKSETANSGMCLRVPKAIFSSSFMTCRGTIGLPTTQGVDWYTFRLFSTNLREARWEERRNFRKNR